MIVKIEDGGVEKWCCTICGHKWMPRVDEVKQLRCPNRKCRKLAGYSGAKNG
jgi:hypothetical protein